jgi:hypothetical protein
MPPHTMPTASLVFDAAYAIGPVPRRLFWSFVEHMGAERPTRLDLLSFLASAADMDRIIEPVIATSDAVGARLNSRKRLNLSFKE